MVVPFLESCPYHVRLALRNPAKSQLASLLWVGSAASCFPYVCDAFWQAPCVQLGHSAREDRRSLKLANVLQGTTVILDLYLRKG